MIFDYFFKGSKARAMIAKQVAKWAQTQNVPIGHVHKLKLPSELQHASTNGVVQIGRLDAENICLLLIEKTGYKGNFDGLFFCTRKLNSDEIIREEAGATSYLSIQGFGVFEELYIRRIHDEQTLFVYFDLN